MLNKVIQFPQKVICGNISVDKFCYYFNKMPVKMAVPVNAINNYSADEHCLKL